VDGWKFCGEGFGSPCLGQAENSFFFFFYFFFLF
jgi:hypothetical protein